MVMVELPRCVVVDALEDALPISRLYLRYVTVLSPAKKAISNSSDASS